MANGSAYTQNLANTNHRMDEYFGASFWVLSGNKRLCGATRRRSYGQEVVFTATLSPSLFTDLIGAVAISGETMAYFIGPSKAAERLFLVAGVVALVYPDLIFSPTGLETVFAIEVFQHLSGRTEKASLDTVEERTA